jgi:hypothetical protein
MQSEGGIHSSGRFELPLALSQGCASLALGYFRPVAPGRGGDLARLRAGTGWRWRDQLNVHAIALGNKSSHSPDASKLDILTVRVCQCFEGNAQS